MSISCTTNTSHLIYKISLEICYYLYFWYKKFLSNTLRESKRNRVDLKIIAFNAVCSYLISSDEMYLHRVEHILGKPNLYWIAQYLCKRYILSLINWILIQTCYIKSFNIVLIFNLYVVLKFSIPLYSFLCRLKFYKNIKI